MIWAKAPDGVFQGLHDINVVPIDCPFSKNSYLQNSIIRVLATSHPRYLLPTAYFLSLPRLFPSTSLVYFHF